MDPKLDDDALMIRTARGEEAAFRLLVHRWEHDVLAFLSAMLGSVEEAEDLVQETFVRVYRNAGKYRPEGMFKSWMLRIAGNLARSRLRRRRIIGWIPFDPTDHDVADQAAGPEDELQAKQTADLVRGALARLPDRQREALVLHRFQGMKYKDIATTMGTTLPGVESLIQRALAALRDELSRGDGSS